MAPDWRAIREEFPAVSQWTYLNTATFGQIPRRATAAVAEHFARRDRFACDDFLSWFDDCDRIRGLCARLIGAQASDIAFIPNASTALSLLLGGIEWKTGDQVVTLRNEFPNQYYYPTSLRQSGVEFIETDYERLRETVGPRTRVVLLSTVNYSTGLRPALEETAAFLRERGVMLYLDGTQSVGALRFDAGAVRPDMLAVHAYKWMLSPNGAGFVYVSPELRERLAPAVIGWRSHKDWRNHDDLHLGEPVFKSDAEKYEGGMPAFALLYGMAAVLEMMLEIGPEAIEARVLELADLARAALRRAGARFPDSPHYRSQIVCGAFDGVDASALARALKEQRVLVAARHGNLRVSPHFYNDESDIARLEEALTAPLRATAR